MSLLCCLIALLQSFTSINAQTARKPNFVFIAADDLGLNDVGWRGSTNVYTPNLDGLRNNNALELTHFYVTPKCSPTRTSFMTGRYSYNLGMQHDVGLTQTHTCGLEPSPDTTYFTERLKTCSGYNNYYMGKWHQGEYKWAYTPIYRGGFDYFKGYLNAQIDYFNFTYFDIYDWRENTEILYKEDTTDNYSTTAFGEKALEIIRNKSINNDDTPFTMIVAFGAPHDPIHFAPHPFRRRALADGNGGPFGNPNNTYFNDRRQYVTMIYAMDYYIGEIINALRNNEVNGERIWDNTYLVFFSDNGGVISHGSNYPLRGAKATNFEGGIRVPALISGGLLDQSLRGTSYDGLVHITDLAATVLDLTNTSTNDLSLDGESLRDLLDPNITTHSRDRLIITADSVACNATYHDEPLCGGIIRDFGDDGIFKLVIGNAVDETTRKFGWVELENMQQILAQSTISLQISCDPMNIGLTQPTYNNDFKASDCGPNGLPCLYKLDEDPCEYENKAEDEQYGYYLNQLINELRAAYDAQAEPLWMKPECNQVTEELMLSFQEQHGYWTPAAYAFTGDESLRKQNTEIYDGGGCDINFATTEFYSSTLSDIAQEKGQPCMN